MFFSFPTIHVVIIQMGMAAIRIEIILLNKGRTFCGLVHAQTMSEDVFRKILVRYGEMHNSRSRTALIVMPIIVLRYWGGMAYW